MTDSELDKILKSAPAPGRDEDYWESFPRIVSTRLRSASVPRPTECAVWWQRLAWGGAIAMACLIAGFWLGHWHEQRAIGARYALLQNGKMLGEVLTLFPNRVRAIVQDEHGVQLVLADRPDVPVSTPLWVKICDGQHCAALVTFSGQEIEVAGQKLTVLTSAEGAIILIGDHFAWSSDHPGHTCGSLEIEARRLGPINL